MELATISMDRKAARQAAADYRRAVRERFNEEDAGILRAYRWLSKEGTQLLRLSDALRTGGTTTVDVPITEWNVQRRRSVIVGQRPVVVPRLAVARADVEFVWTSGIQPDGSCDLRYTRQWLDTRQESSQRYKHAIASGTFDPDDDRRLDSPLRIRAMTPNVPPPLRPTAHLRNYHLLWEAEWEIDRSVPPGDPALLKHIGGDLYAVLAVWDLTPVEQAVLAGRQPEGT